jgi:hypothetical protein
VITVPTRLSPVARMLAFALAAAVTACGSDSPAAPTAAASGLHAYLGFGLGDIAVGSNFFASAYIVRDGVPVSVTSSVSWATTNPSVLHQFSTSAQFQGMAVGTATVTAQFEGLTDSIPVTVVAGPPIPYPYIDLTPSRSVHVGETATARAVYLTSQTVFETVTDIATWSSSNPKVMTVSQGTVRGVSLGFADITVTYKGLSRRYRGWAIPDL